jgi:hypothetical protein
MGRASSSKKVARAAGIGGGRAHHRNTPWGYYGVIGLIVILGLVITFASKQRRDNQINGAGGTPPTVGTVWQEGYAVYQCGKFAPAIDWKNAPNPQGITTKVEGIINIQPKVKSAAGKNAVLGKFADAVGMHLNAAELQVPGGHRYLDGNSCQGQPGHVYIKEFADTTDTVGSLYNGAKGQLPKLDPALVPLKNNAMLVIAFVPSSEAVNIPAPPSYVITNLNQLAAQQASTSTTTATGGGTSATTTSPTTAATPSTTTKPTTSTTAHA